MDLLEFARRAFDEGSPRCFDPLIDPNAWCDQAVRYAQSVTSTTTTADDLVKDAEIIAENWARHARTLPSRPALSTTNWETARQQLKKHAHLSSLAAPSEHSLDGQKVPAAALKLLLGLDASEGVGRVVRRSGNEVAEALDFELRTARELIIVDRYLFTSKFGRPAKDRPGVVSIGAMLSKLEPTTGGQTRRASIFIGQALWDNDDWISEIKERVAFAANELQPSCPRGWKLEVRGLVARSKTAVEDIHQRYLFTHDVGYLIDPGFDDGCGTSNITLMPRSQMQSRRRVFLEHDNHFTVYR